MADDKDKKRGKATPAPGRGGQQQPVAQAVPPAQRLDFLVSGSADKQLDCRAALLFPDNAPLADQALGKSNPNPRAKLVARRMDKSESTPLDLQAVWAHVASPPTKDGSAVMVLLHGFYTYVTIDPAGACALPSWADTDVDTNTTESVLAPKADKAKAPRCLTAGYRVLDAVKSYSGSLITLAPENALPYVTARWQIPAKHIANQVGTLDKDVLGKLITECLDRLTKVKPVADRPKCPPPLSSVPNIQRLFLAGHSGAHSGLYGCAASTYAKDQPTDLMLLDCFYADGTTSLQTFIKNKKGQKSNLGNASGESRILLVHGPSSAKGIYNNMRDALIQQNKGMVEEVKYKEGRTPRDTELNAMAATRLALTRKPIVTVSGPLGHYTIPPDFIPLVLETAK